MAAEEFVTLEEFEEFFGRELLPTEHTRAALLLDWVASAIVSLAGRPEESNLKNYKLVNCGVVERMLALDADMPAVSQVQQTVGPFTGSYTMANPYGSVFFTKEEKRLLGIGKRRVSCFWPYSDRAKEDE